MVASKASKSVISRADENYAVPGRTPDRGLRTAGSFGRRPQRSGHHKALTDLQALQPRLSKGHDNPAPHLDIGDCTALWRVVPHSCWHRRFWRVLRGGKCPGCEGRRWRHPRILLAGCRPQDWDRDSCAGRFHAILRVCLGDVFAKWGLKHLGKGLLTFHICDFWLLSWSRLPSSRPSDRGRNPSAAPALQVLM